MDLNLANNDIHIAEHRRRIARAERFGPHHSTSSAPTSSRRASTVVVTAIGNVLRAIGAALGRIGDLPYDSREFQRSKEHHFAIMGMRWPTNPAYDDALAAELLTARQRRLAAQANMSIMPNSLTRDHETSTSKPQRPSGRVLAHAGLRPRISLRATAAGGLGQAGD